MTEPAVHPPRGSGALAAFLSQLASSEADVQAALATVLGRPRVRVAYWIADDERWVDRSGARVTLDAADPGVTVVLHRGEPVAALQDDGPLPEIGAPLAPAVAVALDNERLQLALRARLEEQQALRRIATVVARQHGPDDVLSLVTSEVARHLAADAAMTARYDGPGLATVVADWSAPGVSHFPVGRQIVIAARPRSLRCSGR